MTVIVGVVFLATLAALHWVHTRRQRRTRRDAQRARADYDREWERLAARNTALVAQNHTLRRLLAEQCQHTLDWKAIAAAQFRRVAELRAPAPEVVDELRQRRDGRGRFTKAASG